MLTIKFNLPVAINELSATTLYIHIYKNNIVLNKGKKNKALKCCNLK